MKKQVAVVGLILVSLFVIACTRHTQKEATASKTDSSLVVYYSWSGNTQRVAEQLAAIEEADIYEIRTIENYPEDGRETASISQEERRQGDLPELVDDFPDLSEYDTIYIGAPIWNAYMPTPLESYLEKVDFTGKTILPFSTSMSSGQNGFLKDFQHRIQNPEKIGSYTDFVFPGNGSPDAYSDQELDERIKDWLANNEIGLSK